jgi:hypothetical protein
MLGRVFFRREQAGLDQFTSLHHAIGMIDAKDFNRDSANGRFSHQVGSTPFEMVVPRIDPRIEERNKLSCLNIVAGDIASLGAVAVRARKASILKRCEAPMFLGSDVVDCIRQNAESLSQATVFAQAPGTQPYEFSAESGHASRRRLDLLE